MNEPETSPQTTPATSEPAPTAAPKATPPRRFWKCMYGDAEHIVAAPDVEAAKREFFSAWGICGPDGGSPTQAMIDKVNVGETTEAEWRPVETRRRRLAGLPDPEQCGTGSFVFFPRARRPAPMTASRRIPCSIEGRMDLLRGLPPGTTRRLAEDTSSGSPEHMNGRPVRTAQQGGPEVRPERGRPGNGGGSIEEEEEDLAEEGRGLCEDLAEHWKGGEFKNLSEAARGTIKAVHGHLRRAYGKRR